MKPPLRNLGIRADYLTPDAKDRTFQSEHSQDVVAALALWVLSSASWDGLKGLGQYLLAWGRQVTGGGLRDRGVSVSIARLERPDGAVLEGLEVRGPANDVPSAVLREIRLMLDVPHETDH